MTTEPKIGDFVIVPDPNDTDVHNHSFQGTIVALVDDLATVVDQDDEYFDIEIKRLIVE